MKKTLTGLFVLGVLALPAMAAADETYQCSSGDPSQDGKTLTFTGSQTLWPPNHKYHGYTVTAATDNGEDIQLDLLGTSDEYTYSDDGTPTGELNGAGHTDFLTDISPNPADGSGNSSVTVPQSVRSERSGTADGRTYTIHAVAKYGVDLGAAFMTTQTCKHDFAIFVPHDKGNH